MLLETGARQNPRQSSEQQVDHLFEALSTSHGPESSAESLASLLCCLPQVELPSEVGYDSVFRIIIMQFLDAHAFDVRSVKKSCVHIVHPEDGRIIPFDTYNLFYRGSLENEVLAPLREEEAAFLPETVP